MSISNSKGRRARDFLPQIKKSEPPNGIELPWATLGYLYITTTKGFGFTIIKGGGVFSKDVLLALFDVLPLFLTSSLSTGSLQSLSGGISSDLFQHEGCTSTALEVGHCQ